MPNSDLEMFHTTDIFAESDRRKRDSSFDYSAPAPLGTVDTPSGVSLTRYMGISAALWSAAIAGGGGIPYGTGGSPGFRMREPRRLSEDAKRVLKKQSEEEQRKKDQRRAQRKARNRTRGKR